MADHPKYLIEKTKQKKFKWTMQNRYGHKLLKSRLYNSKAACKKGIESVRKNGQINKRFEHLKSRSGMHHFNLKARNGLCLGSSEKFNDQKSMHLVVKNILAVCSLAQVLDLT